MPITQKHIAEKLGLHPATVCLALKNHPGIPQKTRERILETARSLGYRRDPMLGALAAYRRKSRPPAFHGVLGWLISTSEGVQWAQVPEYRDYYKGVCAGASKLGYKVAVFDLRDYQDNPLRLVKIFRARNIRGVFVCPQPKAHTILNFDFSELAAIVFGYTIKSPQLHAVTSNHHRSVVEAFQRLRALGYERIGYAIGKEHDERLEDHYLAGFLTEQRRIAKRTQIPLIGKDDTSLDAFRTWLTRYKPDAIIIFRSNFIDHLKALKINIPKHLGVAVIGVMDGFRQYSGIDEDSEEIGSVAAEFLIGKVERGEKGVPAKPQRVLVNSHWHDGQTLQQKKIFD
ncbi:MAG TPA: LacI family DNA-binding transcriptional regulator [Opitutaceae bacterium]|nr:LacI family DNA-binding transcriptional regulator [Opitutaceae bacterium]